MNHVDPKFKNVQLTGPYDSFRDYAAALEARGRLIRIKEMDQDKYELAGFTYKLIDKYGYYNAPAVLVERVKIDGQWVDGPVFSNPYGPWDAEAMGFGVEDLTTDCRDMYRAAREKIKSMMGPSGMISMVDPEPVQNDGAPCKEIIHTGDDIDLEQYAFIKSNPIDAGRYVNMGSLIVEDPVMGRNVGTYRCQIKSGKKIGVNPEAGQGAWNMFMAAKRRGEKSIKAALVVGADPIVWALSSSKAARPGQDELYLAGGYRQSPLQVVKCETSDILVPAHSEMVIEGEVDLTKWEEEGPFGEMYGYMGLKKDENFFMNITAITHRQNPWVLNSFTGVTRGFFTAPMDVAAYSNFRRSIFNLVDITTPTSATGFVIASITKRFAGDGIAAGMTISAALNIAKITVIVDDDVDILDMDQVMATIGARWQPDPASLIIKQARGMRLDPSARIREVSSKIVIDATRQWPDEGGPDVYPELNRTLLEKHDPDLMDRIEQNWPDYIQNWRRPE